MIDGWCITVEPCGSLSQQQGDFIRWKLSILAVSTPGLFDDPVLFTGHSWQAYYLQEYHATETAEQVKAYLQSIGRDGQIRIRLQASQWDRSQKDQLP
jgi:hypothetical protein